MSADLAERAEALRGTYLPEGHAIEKLDEARIDNAGFTIHSAVHMARGDAQFVMHSHTTAGMAVVA